MWCSVVLWERKLGNKKNLVLRVQRRPKRYGSRQIFLLRFDRENCVIHFTPELYVRFREFIESANTQLSVQPSVKPLPKSKLLDEHLVGDVDIKVESPFRGVHIIYFIRDTYGGRILTGVVFLTPPEWDQLMTGR